MPCRRNTAARIDLTQQMYAKRERFSFRTWWATVGVLRNHWCIAFSLGYSPYHSGKTSPLQKKWAKCQCNSIVARVKNDTHHYSMDRGCVDSREATMVILTVWNLIQIQVITLRMTHVQTRQRTHIIDDPTVRMNNSIFQPDRLNVVHDT